MEFIVFVATVFAVIFVIVAINEVAKEVRGLRSVFETQYQLERVPVESENPYKRKGVELQMFEVGELVKRKTLSDGKAKALCVIVNKSEDNYIIYNNSLQTLQTVACVVINSLYTKHT